MSRIETVNGRNIMVGYVWPLDEIKVGQRWAQADGSDIVFTIKAMEGQDVIFGDDTNHFTKHWLDFQTNFCKVIE